VPPIAPRRMVREGEGSHGVGLVHSDKTDRFARPMASYRQQQMDEWVYAALLHPQIPTHPSDFGALSHYQQNASDLQFS
jgi:hypothetical protein